MVLRRYWLSILLTILLGFMLNETAIAQTLETTVSQSSVHKKSPLEGSWNLRLQNSRLEDSFNQKTVSEFQVGLELRYFPVRQVYFHLAPKFTYANGFTQTQSESRSNGATWGVREGSANLILFKDSLISGGALDQSVDHPSLLLGEITFPALKLKVQSDTEAFVVAGVQAETAIPTSNSLSSQTKDFEKTPSFQSASAFVKLQKTIVEGSAQIGSFEFKNLPMAVSTPSGLLGNTTTPTSGTDSLFVYDYKGIFATLELKARMGRFITLRTLAEGVQNDQAPEEFNQARRSKTTLDLLVSRNFVLSPFYEYFHIEPDAVVANYNSYSLNTNRVGYRAGSEIAYMKKIKISLSAGERDVVFESPYQQREKTWYLTLGTFDVAI